VQKFDKAPVMVTVNSVITTGTGKHSKNFPYVLPIKRVKRYLSFSVGQR